MSAPNHNNTTPAANPSTSSSVPKWGEAGFVAIEGARFGEDGFVPCGRPGHRGPRANQQHTAEECRFGGPQRPATNRVPRRQTAHAASYPAPGYGHPAANLPGSGQQNTFPGFGHQVNLPGHGHHQQQFGLGLQNNIIGLDQQISLLALQQQLELQNQLLQLQLLAQQSQQQPSAGESRRGGRQGPSTAAQRNGVKKNKKQGARNHWQPKFRKDNNHGPGGNGSAGAGGLASV